MDLKETKAGITFMKLISKIENDEQLSQNEKEELELAAIEIGAHFEKVGDRRCYWICQGSNWMCNPDNHPPTCKCVKRCT